jgi:hypothetical protein
MISMLMLLMGPHYYWHACTMVLGGEAHMALAGQAVAPVKQPYKPQASMVSSTD